MRGLPWLPSLMLLAAAAPAQPQAVVHWSAEGNDGIYNAIALPDVSGDSLPDVAAATYYGATPSDPRKAYCYSGADGDTVWVSRSAYGTWGNKGLDSSADLDGDGFADILLGTVGTYLTPGRSVIAVSGRSGDTLWTYSRGQDWGWVYCVRSLGDVDGDSVPDVVAAAGTSSGMPGAGVLVSGSTGQEIWFFRLPSDAGQCVAPFADIDADSVPDVLLGAGGNSINDTAYCLSGASGLPLWATGTFGSVSDIERIGDVNASGFDDCIGGGWSDSVFCLEGSTGGFIWGTDIGRVVMEVVPVRDLDADAIPDLIVGSWDSNVHVLSGADGSSLWNAAVGQDVWMVDTLADVTGDGRPEVVAGALNGHIVRLFDGATGSPLWQYGFSERVYDVTGAPDLNGDSHPDVLVGLQDQANQADHIYCLDGNPPSGVEELPDRTRPVLSFDPVGRVVRCPPGPGTEFRLDIFDPAGRRAAGPFRATGDAALCLPPLPAGPYVAVLSRSRAAPVAFRVLLYPRP